MPISSYVGDVTTTSTPGGAQRTAAPAVEAITPATTGQLWPKEPRGQA